MKLIVSAADRSKLDGKYKFIDNDFLGILYKDEDIFAEAVKFLGGNLLVDPLTRFEFLRDVQEPEIRAAKEIFISNEEFFTDAGWQHEIFKDLLTNALVLSRYYAHNGRAGASTVDLILGAQLMKRTESALLVTGNKKDFPPFLFDTVAVMNYEEKGGNMRAITVLKLSTTKITECETSYRTMVEAKKRRE